VEVQGRADGASPRATVAVLDSGMTLEIREHPPGGNMKDFLRAGRVLFRDDPAYVVPLDMDLGDRLNPKKNPLFDHAEATLFTAHRDGKIVGRVSASVDHDWLKLYEDETGHFGFFDTIDDEGVARALLARAESWLRDKGMKRALGPMSLSANEEIGILVDGFEHPPVLMMGHSRRWQGALCEACGYVKKKDLYAWRFDKDVQLKKRTLEAWEEITALPEVTLRSIDMKRFHQELAIVVDIYNEAWAGKWGFVPFTDREVQKMGEDLKLVIDPDLAFVAVIDGEPIGMCVMVPNVNEAIRDLDGALFPFGWAKLLWRLKVSGLKSTRLILLGIRERVRKNVHRYGGLSAAMYVEVQRRGVQKGYEWSELGWTREDDAPINVGIRAMGAKIYKTYRVYEKAL
jgi:GNAT superfamily N-acetyltransferase